MRLMLHDCVSMKNSLTVANHSNTVHNRLIFEKGKKNRVKKCIFFTGVCFICVLYIFPNVKDCIKF